MAKHSDSVLQRNALKGAITTWCPACGRKSALSEMQFKLTGSIYEQGSIHSFRTCRYCGHVETRSARERRKLYDAARPPAAQKEKE